MNWWYELTEENFQLEKKEILFGITERRTRYCSLLNLIVFYGKYFIYKSRLNKVRPIFSHFEIEIKDLFQKERKIATKKGEHHYKKFEQMWKPYV